MSAGLEQGTIFAGRYEVLRRIAAGGMGAVYEVRHIETARRRALKVMAPPMFQSAEFRERFKLEARISAEIESEFIVEVVDAGIDEATQMLFLVMELLKGEDLRTRLKQKGRFLHHEVVTYLHQTALALDKTHKAGIVHRDLKPDNLFLTRRDDGQPRIKVLDFGVAKVIVESEIAAGGTKSLGTPLYMAPEQFDPEARLTGAADIYALGMMAYTFLVGAPYWAIEAKSGNVVTFAMCASKGPPDPATTRAKRHDVSLPLAFDAWFSRVTSVDPARRFPVATAAIAALAESLGLNSTLPAFPLEQAAAAPAPNPISQSGELPTTVFNPKSPSATSPSDELPTAVLAPRAPKPASAVVAPGEPSPRRGSSFALGLAVGIAVLGTGAFVMSRLAKTALGVAVTAASAEPSAEATAAAAPPSASAPPPLSASNAAAPSTEPAAGTADLAASAPPPSAAPSSAGTAKAAPSGRASSSKPAGSAPQKGHPDWGQQ